jgi:hypothetical protein
MFFFLPVFAEENSFTYPVEKGNYYICPNGKGISKYFWKFGLTRFDNVNLKNFEASYTAFNGWSDELLDLTRMSSNYSEVLIGKKALFKYSSDVINQLKRRMLLEGIESPNKYKMTRFYPSKRNLEPIYSGKYFQKLVYEFKNSEGKILKIIKGNDWTNRVIDNSNKEFIAYEVSPSLGMFYCTPNSINVKLVRQLKFKKITNDLGDSIQLPYIFWVTDVGIKSQIPIIEENTFDF